MVAQDLRLMEPPNAKGRPLLIVTFGEAITVLNNIVVAPVTSTIRANPPTSPWALVRASLTTARQFRQPLGRSQICAHPTPGSHRPAAIARDLRRIKRIGRLLTETERSSIRETPRVTARELSRSG